jgi:glycine/D-amino acid oxidase-like deaminating enzyme
VGRLDPRRFCVGLAEAINGDGEQTFEQTRALDLRPGFPCAAG